MSSGDSEKKEREWTDGLQEDYDRILSVGEECISADELRRLLLAKGRGSGHPKGFVLYDGFEPSGRMHIAQGVFKAMNVNKCTLPQGTNSTFVFWVADWFALMNDKMGGDLDKIKIVGEYLIEVWKAAGMNLDNVVFKWASDEITDNASTYWPIMLDVARRFNVTRIKKCCQIMGRLEGSLTAAQVLYPLMQCTDVFFLEADICQLGVDQRKVNMLAREYCDASSNKKKGKRHKPVVLSHHMLYGLKAGQEKMSKSDPDSAIFMEDKAEDVERKIMQAYCPTREEDSGTTRGGDQQEEDGDAGKASLQLVNDSLKNPCLDYIQHIIFSPPGATFSVDGGSKVFDDFDMVKSAFLEGTITEEQLKRGLVNALNGLLEPVRTHFATDDRARQLLADVRTFKKESDSPKAKVVRRLDLVALGRVPKDCHLVFAPLPTADPTLQEAVDVLEQLRLGYAAGRPCVLYLSDWSARVCGACDADVKLISAYYAVLVASLRILDPALMKSDKVQVLLQSDAILSDPSNYWISVINVGRHFMLNDVMGPDMRDSDGVGLVISRLMRVADVAGIDPASLALSEREGSVSELERGLVTKFYQAKLAGMTEPEITLKSGRTIRLQQERESEALKTENDEYFILDDPKVISWKSLLVSHSFSGSKHCVAEVSSLTSFEFLFL